MFDNLVALLSPEGVEFVGFEILKSHHIKFIFSDGNEVNLYRNGNWTLTNTTQENKHGPTRI